MGNRLFIKTKYNALYLYFSAAFFGTSLFAQNYVMTWQHCYGGTELDWVRSIIPYKDGSLFFGYSSSNDGDISNTANTGAAWLVNIDQHGEIIFDNCYTGPEDRDFWNQIDEN